MVSEGGVSVPYLLVGPGISQSNSFDRLPSEARRARITAEARSSVNALDLWEAGVCTAL